MGSLPLRTTALAGGVGAARLLRGLAALLPAERLTVIVNTADDEEFYGLAVSPDIDTTVYNLAGVAPERRGWGLAGDTSHTFAALRRFRTEQWFALGDRDLATHLFRTRELAAGKSLSAVTRSIARAWGVLSPILPMSNDPVRTRIHTRDGHTLSFQRYFVERAARDRVAAVTWQGLRRARPAPGVLTAIRAARLLIVPPSNPFTSILPILGLRGVRQELRRRRAPAIAVSPVVGGRAVRGPLGGMLRASGLPVSPLGIAEVYDGLIDALVIDSVDRRLAPRLERIGIRVAVTDIRMTTVAKSRAVARQVLALADELARPD